MANIDRYNPHQWKFSWDDSVEHKIGSFMLSLIIRQSLGVECSLEDGTSEKETRRFMVSVT